MTINKVNNYLMSNKKEKLNKKRIHISVTPQTLSLLERAIDFNNNTKMKRHSKSMLLEHATKLYLKQIGFEEGVSNVS